MRKRQKDNVIRFFMVEWSIESWIPDKSIEWRQIISSLSGDQIQMALNQLVEPSFDNQDGHNSK